MESPLPLSVQAAETGPVQESVAQPTFALPALVASTLSFLVGSVLWFIFFLRGALINNYNTIYNQLATSAMGLYVGVELAVTVGQSLLARIKTLQLLLFR